jgi:hypothetical protein
MDEALDKEVILDLDAVTYGRAIRFSRRPPGRAFRCFPGIVAFQHDQKPD